jgi:hypothetical protein
LLDQCWFICDEVAALFEELCQRHHSVPVFQVKEHFANGGQVFAFDARQVDLGSRYPAIVV